MLAGALNQAREARLAILEVMAGAIDGPRPDVGENAPKISSFEIPVEKIGEVIGPKGKMINTIQAETGAQISVDDDGMVGIVSVASPDREKVAEAERQIMLIVDPPSAHVGEVYEGRVVNITKFGAFVNVLPGRDGLVHISKLGGGKRIDRVEDVLELGQSLEVVVEDIDPNGKISLRPTSDDSAPRPTRSSDDSAPRSEQPSDDRADGNPVEDADHLDAPNDRVDDFVDGSDDDFEDDDDDFGDAPGSSNRDEPVTVSASFEEAFQAELETVHGDLGVAVRPERSGGRRRRSR